MSSDEDDEFRVQLEKVNGVVEIIRRTCDLAMEKFEDNERQAQAAFRRCDEMRGALLKEMGSRRVDDAVLGRACACISGLESENERLAVSALRSRELLERARSVIERLKGEREEKARELEHLKSEMESLEFLYESALQEKEEVEARNENLLRQLETARERWSGEGARKLAESDLREQLRERDAEIARLGEVIGKKERMIEDQAQRCEDHMRCLKMCQEELRQQSSMSEQHSEERTASEGSFVSEQVMLSEKLRDGLVRLRTQAAQLEDQGRNFQMDMGDKNRCIEELQKQVARYEQELKELKGREAKREQEISVLCGKLDKEEKARMELQKENEDLKQKLLESSGETY